MAKETLQERIAIRWQRAAKANEFIAVIASCGARHFSYIGRPSSFEIDQRGLVWFRDSYSMRCICTHRTHGRWKGFTNGGTMRALVIHLRDYIMTGEPQPLNLGPWPDWLCGGDLWDYGKDMDGVRLTALRLGLTK